MEKRTLVVCTRNLGKLAEIQELLANLPFEVKGLADVGVPADREVEESALTYEGNAIIKAMTYGRELGELCLADDTGLEVDILGGRPGVHTSRYGATDEARRTRLLQELVRVPNLLRGAKFRCVITIFDPKNGRLRSCEGLSHGKILREAKGELVPGIGFDTLFYDERAKLTYAELTRKQKLFISHRGKALYAARDVLKAEFAPSA